MSKDPSPALITTMSALGAKPAYFALKAAPFPTAVPATCVPCPSISFSRTNPAGVPSISLLICVCVYSTPKLNPVGADSPVISVKV